MSIAEHGDETFRATVQARNGDGEIATLIVTRRGLGKKGRVWLTLAASMRTTAVLTDAQATGLIADLLAAQGATEPARPGVTQPRRGDR